MASAPFFKLYDSRGNYQASFKEVEAAAACIGFYGDGSTIRGDHTLVLWTEGAEDQPASESFDHVASTTQHRLAVFRAGVRAKADAAAARYAAQRQTS
jgi:hypothetical protein